MSTLKEQILDIARTHPNYISLEGLPIVDFLVSKRTVITDDQVLPDLDWLEEFDELNKMNVPVGAASRMADIVYTLKGRR